MKKDEMAMDEQSFTEVLKTILEHEDQTQKFMNGMEAQRKQDAGQVEKLLKHNEQLIGSFEKKYSNIHVDAPKPDLSEVNATMDKGFENVKAAVYAHPNRKFQVILFPEYHSKEYFKLVYGRLLFWWYMFILSFLGYNMAKDALNAYRANQYNKEGNAHIEAWDNVYKAASKKTKASMSEVLQQAEKNQ
ncbi:hypothetical protein HDF24_25140 [Mucilaginibacter sp. X4EP1]|jgi:hypothetical protein|uniref:hypothetical protein n=1 Tax=Mucilaginibacter sp. X4EP1 TaxID=2723092 RepID=UPI002168138C|nr:hypothetical protein [Mucilaginibacter sp. X4EP1]MCS3815103.1 hypothetical protein [Mucilaginibacter sp. X4EP1]